MAIRKIARLGEPVLHQVAARVKDPQAASVRHLIADMTETLTDAEGVGLAAPQVFESLAVMMFFVPAARAVAGDDPDGVPLTILINPEIEPIDETLVHDWEGCLSIPELLGEVPRWARIRYRGLDAHGRSIAREAGGFHARVVQHEYDHLRGVLYPERMIDMRRLGFARELRRADG